MVFEMMKIFLVGLKTLVEYTQSLNIRKRVPEMYPSQ